jgi:hypothetical protein
MLPRASHIMTCLQCVLCTVAVLFDGALALSFASTTVALFGFGSLSSSADTRTFALTILAHLCAATLTFAVFGGHHRSDLCSACFVAVLCAEARVRAATSVCRPRREVMWACRAATAGSVFTLTFRALVLPGHVSTAALGVCAASAPWYWDAHRAWRAVFPPQLPPPTVWSVTLLTLLAGATWGAQFNAYV